MSIYSSWLETAAPTSEIEADALTLGSVLLQDFSELDSGRAYRMELSYADSRETAWESSTSTGHWVTAMIETTAGTRGDPSSRLLGIAAPSQALADDLRSQIEDLLEDSGGGSNRATFRMRNLLDPTAIQSGVRPISIRLQDDERTALIRSQDWATLRNRIAGIPGDIIGITVALDDRTITVLEGGTVVFDAAATLQDIFSAMSRLTDLMRLAELA